MYASDVKMVRYKAFKLSETFTMSRVLIRNCHLNYNTTKCASPEPPAPPLQAFWNAFEFVPSTNQLAD